MDSPIRSWDDALRQASITARTDPRMGQPFPPHERPPFGSSSGPPPGLPPGLPPGPPPAFPPQPPGFPPGPPGPPGPGYPTAYPASPRPPRTGLAVVATAVVTLSVAGLLTWAGATAFASPDQVRSAPGLPSDPCSELGEDTLDGIDGEFSSWYTGTYANGCTWTTSLGGQDETLLYLTRSVPMSGADARAAEAFAEDEEIHRDADAMFRATVEEAGELGYESDEASVADTEEKPLDFGDESVLVVTDIGYGFSDSVSQRVTLIVREGDLVSQVDVNPSSGDDPIDADGAEELLADVATDLFA